MTFTSAGVRKQRWKQLITWLLIGTSGLTGCRGYNEKTLHYIGDKDLQYYVDVATKIEYPDVDEPTPENVAFSQKPRVLGDRAQDEIWDMSLAEAIQLALRNNKIVRSRNEFLSPGNGLYTNPDNITSVYDTAIRESGVLFGNRGVESALAAFDTQWTTRMLWNNNQQIQNNIFALGGIAPGAELLSDTATFNTSLSKQMAYGAQLSLSHNWNYSANNQTGRLFRSAYDGAVTLNYRQPLWAGAGADVTRIAGPAGTNIEGLSGVNQGVVIARINTDISLVDFEVQVRNMLRDVEDIYWDLYLAYRSYDAEVTARNSAYRTWREVKAKFDIGAPRGGAADEAQARESYFDARSRSENQLQNLYSLELNLRRLCGLPASDGRIIRPADEPITAEIIPEWHVNLAEALTRREELRRQKWNIKSLELQLFAARNLANPRLDFVSSYQVNGFGDDLFAGDGGADSPAPRFESAYRSLRRGNQTGYGLGFEFSLPLGLRQSKAQVRNSELRLVKAKEVLAIQEYEISHELANSFQTMKWRYATAQTNFNRRNAAERQLKAFQAEYEVGTKTLDLLLQAQTRLAVAETAYYTSVVNYNKALTDLHYRKGTLLENNNVHLSEGMWTPEAYRDAIRRAWARTFAFDTLKDDPVHHHPHPFVNEDVLGHAEFIGEDAARSLQRDAQNPSLPERDPQMPMLPGAPDGTLVPPAAPPVPAPRQAPPQAPPGPSASHRRFLPAPGVAEANRDDDSLTTETETAGETETFSTQRPAPSRQPSLQREAIPTNGPRSATPASRSPLSRDIPDNNEAGDSPDPDTE